jgi:transposase-like protein
MAAVLGTTFRRVRAPQAPPFVQREERAAILRRHHLEKVPAAKICEDADIQPSLFYHWQKQAFENLETALQPDASLRVKALEKQVEVLEVRVARKDAVIAQVTEEYVAAKGAWGALNGRAWVSPDIRDDIVDFVSRICEPTEESVGHGPRQRRAPSRARAGARGSPKAELAPAPLTGDRAESWLVLQFAHAQALPRRVPFPDPPLAAVAA